ncbi:hypothetical protein AB1484_22560 [Parafrankia sp. FMc6]|uniref:hypothetical protein n=1 Tax=Parafrankia soli TaxID=2599596 RepID=UPI0034D404B0
MTQTPAARLYRQYPSIKMVGDAITIAARNHRFTDGAMNELRYNTMRRHSALGYRTPCQVHDEYLKIQSAT